MVVESPRRLVGYWREARPTAYLGYPDPALLVDDDWEAARRQRIVAYLEAGATLVSYMGFSRCRFKDCQHPRRDRLGTKDLTDGRWIWPEGLAHYVRDHHVRIPDEMIRHMAERGFKPPTLRDDELAPFAAADAEFWVRWAAEHTMAPAAERSSWRRLLAMLSAPFRRSRT